MNLKILSVVAELRALPRDDQEWLLAELQQIADQRLADLKGSRQILGADKIVIERRLRAIGVGKKLLAAAWEMIS